MVRARFTLSDVNAAETHVVDEEFWQQSRSFLAQKSKLLLPRGSPRVLMRARRIDSEADCSSSRKLVGADNWEKFCCTCKLYMRYGVRFRPQAEIPFSLLVLRCNMFRFHKVRVHYALASGSTYLRTQLPLSYVRCRRLFSWSDEPIICSHCVFCAHELRGVRRVL